MLHYNFKIYMFSNFQTDSIIHHLSFLKPMNAPSQKYLYKTFQKYKVIQTCCCCCSVIQLCPTLCNPMGHSTPGLPAPHHLQKFAQVHFHCIGDAIQPSHPLIPSFPSAFNLSKHQRLSNELVVFHRMTKILELQLQQTSGKGDKDQSDKNAL